MTATTPDTFDPRAPLPVTGLHVLEASAGTGKTFTIAELCRRYVAEGTAEIGQLLVMTFGRSATQELRDRVRRELQRYIHQEPEPAEPDRAQRVRRAQRALADFDSAAIMTIHEFCTDAFSRFGIRADADPDEQVAEDLSDVVADASGDVYLSQFWLAPPLATPDAKGKLRTTALTPFIAGKLAASLQANPDAELITEPDTELDPERQRIAYAQGVLVGIGRTKHRTRTISFDDMVIRLRQAIQQDPDARQSLRNRFAAVLVDEFQDTDPSQWAIVRDTFVAAGAPGSHAPAVVLIGDPKQGIYGFRGADINSYTSARDTPGAQARTLGTNYRSDGPVVRGVLDLLQGLELGDGIVVGHVAANEDATRISGPAMDPQGRRVRLRLCRGPADADAESMRQLIASDVANEIARTLQEGASITVADPRPVAPGDFAVIVRTNRQAETIRSELQRGGIPAVVNSQVSVFASAAAGAWLSLLQAMERPTGATVREAALTPFFDADPAALADGASQEPARIAEQIRTQAALFHEHGVPAVLARALSTVSAQQSVLYGRLLARPDGERFLTDLRHVAALLHQAQRQHALALTGLTDWLTNQVAEADEDGQERSEALTRRLDSDADAVQVVTIHRCKGLQYGIAYVPFGTNYTAPSDSAVVCTTDQGSQPQRKRRVIDVRSYNTGSSIEAKKSQTTRLKAIREAEAQAEELRMLYVAMTRGIHEVVLTWASPKLSAKSPLHRALAADSGLPADSYPVDPAPRAKADRSPHVKVEEVVFETPTQTLRRNSASSTDHSSLAAAPFDRANIDTAWTRSSFSGLTKQRKHRAPELVDDAAVDVKDDEPEVTPPDDTSAESSGTAMDTASAFNSLPRGMAFGTLVHAVLEHVDTRASDLPSELRLRCREQLALRPIGGATETALADALEPVMHTPLGHLAPGVSLAQVSPADRLPELDFELPLHQGATAAASVAAIGAALARAENEPDWVRQYGQSLRTASFSWKQLRGYLVGSIDAVLRIDGRFVVVDYKSNMLGGPEGRLFDYRPAVLPDVMAEAHYPLQALLYSVALHRFLQLRLTGYQSEQHLGGILYLFVRGMAGPGTPTDAAGDPCGVFSWRPSSDLVTSLSELLGSERT